jgi:chemotaxis protein CheY-P-specific phosphatase CheC
VELPFQGTVPSLYTLFFDDAAARALVAHLLRTAEAAPSTLGDSALCEVGNITACAFGDALARRTGMPWMPSVPTLRRGRLSPTNNPFILTSQVLTGQREPRGRLVWLLDRAHAFALSQVFEELPRSDLNGR